MKLPVTNIAVMLPDGHRLNLMPMNDSKQVEVMGLQFGPMLLSRAEAAGLQQMLNTAFPDDK